jgi:hypothetical protein
VLSLRPSSVRDVGDLKESPVEDAGCCASSPSGKRDPVLGNNSRKRPHCNPGIKKKIGEKKKLYKPPSQKKVRALPFAGAKKKKSGLSRRKRKLPRLFGQMPSSAPPTHLPTKYHNNQGPAYPLSPIGFCWFISEPGFSQVRMWLPFN